MSRRACSASPARDMDGTFVQLIAERCGRTEDDPTVGAMGAAISGVVNYAYMRWLNSGRTTSQGEAMAEALYALRELDVTPRR